MTYRDPFAMFDVLATIGRMLDRHPYGQKKALRSVMDDFVAITGSWDAEYGVEVARAVPFVLDLRSA